jgi:hypothetical protein
MPEPVAWRKTTQLTEDTAPLVTDLVMTVDDPAGTPLSKKVQITNLPTVAAGGIYVEHGVAAQALTANTPAKITGFTNDMDSTANITPAHASDQITVGRAGLYKIFWQISSSSSFPNTTFDAHVPIGKCFKLATLQALAHADSIHWLRPMSSRFGLKPTTTATSHPSTYN